MITELRHESGNWMEYPKYQATKSNAIAANMQLKSVAALTRQHFEVRTCDLDISVPFWQALQDIMKKYSNKLTEGHRGHMQPQITGGRW
jgi:hypothetical protein